MATDISIRVTGVDTKNLDSLIQTFPEKADRAGRKMMEEMKNDAVMSMQESPADASKTYGKRGHHPSFPGKPPRPDIGTLKDSIHWVPDGTLRWRLQDGVEYGAYLEYGTETIAARPWLAPVFDDWRVNRAAGFLKQELSI